MNPERHELVENLGVDVTDLADPAGIDDLFVAGFVFGAHRLELARADESVVLAREPDRPAPLVTDESDDLLVDLAAEHHLDDVHRGFVGDAKPGDERGADAHLFERGVDLRAAAVDDHHLDADVAEEADVLGEARLELGVDHGVAAVFDDERAPMKSPDVRKSLVQDRGFLDGILHLGEVFSTSSGTLADR